MSVHRDFYQELLHRVTALEYQLASLRDWLKRDHGAEAGENSEPFEQIARVQSADFLPRAGAPESRPSIGESERFRRRFREGSLKYR